MGNPQDTGNPIGQSQANRKPSLPLWPTFFLVFAAVWMLQLWQASPKTVTIPYSQFQTLLEHGDIESVEIGANSISGQLKAPDSEGHRYVRAQRIDPDLADYLAAHNVEYAGAIENTWLRSLLISLLPMVLLIGVWLFVLRRMGAGSGASTGIGGLMSVGKSKAKVYVEKDTSVTFEDVAGVDEAKDELREIVAFLKDPSSYERLGAHIPKGILLVGPPGTGKTLLARAVAGEAGVPFYSISGSEFVEMFVGVGAARVRDLFDQARQHAPCIIFIDELDALGRARGIGPTSGGRDEKEQTLNQLLSELDGFDTQQGIVLLSATNRPEILDPALLRAGRFDRQVLVDRPDKLGRVGILRVHVRRIELHDNVKLDEIAGMTAGFTGADLANLVNEAAIMATRRAADAVETEDFVEAVERIVAGLEKKNRLLNPYERKVVAVHEMGHALVRIALPGTETVQKVSIIPRGIGALGYNIQRPTEDRYLMTREELESKLAVLMAGRAAEMLVFERYTTGAVDDLNQASRVARSMVLSYGMDAALGQVAYLDEPTRLLPQERVYPLRERIYSEATAADIDQAVRRLIDEAFALATSILERNRSMLDESAARLLECETLSADELPMPVWQSEQGMTPAQVTPGS